MTERLGLNAKIVTPKEKAAEKWECSKCGGNKWYSHHLVIYCEKCGHGLPRASHNCKVCGKEEHNEARYWNGHIMCIDCYDAMLEFDDANRDSKRLAFWEKVAQK